MNNERIEWVEIIEPKTKEHMYANLSTGECVWDPPVGVQVKKTDNNQWWELFDENTSRFYYYNATSQKTVWHRPHNSDIIPLAKLQTLKQNTEPIIDSGSAVSDKKTKESVATQTPGRTTGRVQTAVVTSTRPIKTLDGSDNSNLIIKPSFVPRQSISCETQTSPISPRRSHHHHHHHHHHHSHNHRHQQQITANHPVTVKLTSQPVWYNKNSQSQESGRSSDSSSISGYNTKSNSENATTALVPFNNGHVNPLKKVPLAETNSTPSIAAKSQIPIIHRSGSSASQHQTHLSKQKSFDTDISVGGGYSLGHENRGGTTRCKPIIMSSSMSTNTQTQVTRSQSFAQRSPASNTSIPTDEDEDSMHEKYFSSNILAFHSKKPVDSTPLIRRKQVHNEMCSPGSATSNTKPMIPPEYVNFVSPPPPPLAGLHKTPSLNSRSSSSNSSTVASVSKLPLSVGKSRSDVKFSSSDDLNVEEDEGNDSSSLSVSSSPPTAATPPRKLHHLKSTVLPLENDFEKTLKNSSRPASNHSASSSSHIGYTGSNNSIAQSVADRKITTPVIERKVPLYSNMEFIDLQRQAQLLPLHQYILEQAKLSGCYKFSGADRRRVTEEDIDWSAIQFDDEEHVREEYDSDEFADDEGMSNLEDDEDSSSQEYLHEEPPGFLQDDTRNSSRYNNKKFTMGARVCDYIVVDGIDENKLEDNDVYYNVPPNETLERGGGFRTSNSTQPSSTHLNNLVHTTSSGYRNTSPVQQHSNSETQHASLKRRKDIPVTTSALYSPILERTERLVIPSQSSYFYRKDILRQSDHAITYRDEIPYSGGLNKEKKLPSESDIEKYAQDNLNIHKRGIFRKKFSVRAMLSWSKDPIRKPMLVLSDKTLKKDACDLFKLVQIYMGDRKAKIGMTLNNVALEICNMAYNKPTLRDELYIQICRQTTENPRKESLRRGWELLAICLAFFPPSSKFQAYLDTYMNRHRDPSYDFPEIGKWPIHVQVSHYATIACKRLERGGVAGKRPPKKPSLDEIDQARIQIFRPSMFGSTLQEIIDLQKERFPHYKLPWLQTTLSEQIIRLQGTQTEGIFRVPADMDEVMSLKTQLDRWEVPQDIIDAHTPASVLKLWYRELYEPLIPDSMYEACVTYHDNPERVLAIVQELPEINRLVLAYLIRFLQMFAKQEIALITKMDASNLAMVMAPNCLRCTSQDPRVIFDNARKEMAFMRTLIQHMDTDFVEGIF